MENATDRQSRKTNRAGGTTPVRTMPAHEAGSGSLGSADTPVPETAPIHATEAPDASDDTVPADSGTDADLDDFATAEEFEKAARRRVKKAEKAVRKARKTERKARERLRQEKRAGGAGKSKARGKASVAGEPPFLQEVLHPVDSIGDRLRKANRRHTVSVRLVGWSVVIGVISGLVVGGFRYSIGRIIGWLQQVYRFTTAGNWWMLAVIALASVLLSIAVAWMVITEPASSGSGIPYVEARLRSKKPIDFNWWGILWRKVVGGLCAFAPGLFLGREGPSVQIASCVGMGLSSASKTTRKNRKDLVAAGAAAGLAGAFTAPIAGTLFVMEEIYAKFSLQTGICSFSAALASSAVAVQIFGLEPVFKLPTGFRLPLEDYWQLLLVAVVIGLLAKAYERTIFAGIDFYRLLRVPGAWRPLIPMLLTIPVGVFFPQLLGGGNGLVTLIGRQRFGFWTLALYFVIRLVLSQLSYGCGAPGGIFLPILTLGALAGAGMATLFVAMGASAYSPAYVSLLTIVGMAGLFGAATKAPLTAIILVVEMTSYSELLPLGVVTLGAYLVYDLAGGKPIYDELGAYASPVAKRLFTGPRVEAMRPAGR